jgi:hypothetical protein
MCSALTPADFRKAGLPVSALRQANLNPDDNTGAYCAYDSFAGQVEFDIFCPLAILWQTPNGTSIQARDWR